MRKKYKKNEVKSKNKEFFDWLASGTGLSLETQMKIMQSRVDFFSKEYDKLKILLGIDIRNKNRVININELTNKDLIY